MSAAEEPLEPVTVLFSGPADEPHAGYLELLQRCPVAHSSFGTSDGQTVYISGWQDVSWALRHPEVFSSAAAVPIEQERPLIPTELDPPLHTAFRRLLSSPFTLRRVASHEPAIRRKVTDLIDAFIDRGHCEFNDEFATPLPSSVFLALFGLPYEDLPMFLRWRDDIVRPDVEPGDFDAAAALRARANREIVAYFEAAIERFRVDPNDGLYSEVVHADFGGRPLTQDELLGIGQLMLIGGLNSVTASLDCMMLYLAGQPDQRRQLVEDPSCIPAAIEEMLRAETPIQVIPRAVVQPVTVGGVDLQPGDSAWLVLGAANLDETVFPNPSRRNFGRDASKHVAWGGGNHVCLGAPLARLELRIALEEFLRRIPDYRIANGAEIHFSPGIRQADHLPLVWDPPASAQPPQRG